MGVFDRQRATALRLITAKGAAATFRRPGPGETRDPVTQAVTATAAPVLYNRKAVGFAPGRTWEVRGNTLIGRFSEELQVAPAGYVPDGADTVLWKGQEWKLVDWIDLDPNGEGSLLLRVLIQR